MDSRLQSSRTVLARVSGGWLQFTLCLFGKLLFLLPLRWLKATFDCSVGIIATLLNQAASQPIWLRVTIAH
jgi:hypothetical protein